MQTRLTPWIQKTRRPPDALADTGVYASGSLYPPTRLHNPLYVLGSTCNCVCGKVALKIWEAFESPPRFVGVPKINMLTPTSTTSAFAMPTAFMAAPPTPPSVLAEKMNISRRSCAPRLGASPRSWSSSLGSAVPPAHGDVAARHTRPPTALYSLGRDFPSPARSPLHSTSPAGWAGDSDADETCFASRLLASQHHATSPAASSGSSAGRGRRSSTRLCGLRKPRGGADGSGSDRESDEEAGGGGDKAKTSRTQKSYGSSVPASKRGPPEEEDIWSKHSVFEFKRCGVFRGRAVLYGDFEVCLSS